MWGQTLVSWRFGAGIPLDVAAMGIYEEEWIMDSNASRSSEDDTTKSGGGKAESGGDKIGGQGQPPFIGYDAEYDRTIRESAKQDLIESDALQNVLFKIYRGEFDKLKPSGKKSSTGSQESEADGSAADDSEADAEGGGAEEAHGEEDR